MSETYFKMNEDSFFGIRVYKWCRYRNYEGKHTYGYEIHYDEGDKYYIIPLTTSEKIRNSVTYLFQYVQGMYIYVKYMKYLHIYAQAP